MGRRKAAAVTQADIESFHRSLKETPTQANRTLSLLSKAFNIAERWGWRPQHTNPVPIR